MSVDSMPGAFIGDEPVPSRSTLRSRTSDLSNEQYQKALEVVDTDHFQQFSRQQHVSRKSIKQGHLISQLEAVVFILIGYQFVKYNHSASIVPVITSLVIQKLLCSDYVRNSGPPEHAFIGASDLMTKAIEIAQAERDKGMDQESIDETISIFFSKICATIYWNALCVIIYHILFLSFWMIPIIDRGEVDVLTHGTWWFVSFIGEYRAVDNWQDLNYFGKMAKLGVVGLTLSNLIILLIQLTFFQSICKQSSFTPLGRRLEQPEVEILRKANESTSSTLTPEDLAEICPVDKPPVVIRVRLGETFTMSSFVPTQQI